MPPSVHKLTPLEKRLRRIAFWARLGHDATAPNCYWAKPPDRASGRKNVCDACVKLREGMKCAGARVTEAEHPDIRGVGTVIRVASHPTAEVVIDVEYGDGSVSTYFQSDDLTWL